MLTVPMATKDNKGFFIRPPRQLVNRLSQLAEQFKKGSANQVAVEVITEYLNSWVEIETARQEALAMQQERFSQIKAEMLRRPLHRAETEQTSKSLASERKRRK